MRSFLALVLAVNSPAAWAAGPLKARPRAAASSVPPQLSALPASLPAARLDSSLSSALSPAGIAALPAVPALPARTALPAAPALGPSPAAARPASGKSQLSALGGELAAPARRSNAAPLLRSAFDGGDSPSPAPEPVDASRLREERLGYFLDNARSIAIVGASPTPGKVGNSILRNLVATAGDRARLYPVNPRVAAGGARELGLTWRARLSDLPETVDLVVIAVPADQVKAVMEEAVQGGHRSAIIVTAGLAESGRADEEREIMALAKSRGVPVVGMNSLGVALAGQNASFGRTPLEGPVTFLSQSGAMITGGEDLLRKDGLGFRSVFSLGNKSDVNESDLLGLAARDPKTKAVVGYLEDVKDGARFLETARELTKTKPVVLLRSGRTALGEAASAAHTAAIGGGTFGLFQAAAEQAGIILVDSTRKLFELAKRLAQGLLPEGAATHVRRKASAEGHPFPAIDVVGDAKADRYAEALSALNWTPEVEAIVVIVSPQEVTDIPGTANAIYTAYRESGKVIVPVLFGGAKMRPAEELLRDHIVTFTYPEDAVDWLKIVGVKKGIAVVTNAGGLGVQIADYAVEQGLELAEYSPGTIARLQAALPPSSNVHSFGKPHEPSPKPRTRTLTEEEATRFLESGGLRYPRLETGADLAQLTARAEASGYAGGKGFVLKVLSPDIAHSVRVGGVAMKDGKVWFIKNTDDLREAYERMRQDLASNAPEARIEGFLLSEAVPGRHEVIIGLERSPVFGLAVTLGAGGSGVEQKDDAVKTVLTEGMSREEKLDFLRRRFARLRIHGELVQDGADVEKILEAALQVYELGRAHPDLLTVDVNPVKVNVEEGRTEVTALDAWVEFSAVPEAWAFRVSDLP